MNLDLSDFLVPSTIPGIELISNGIGTLVPNKLSASQLMQDLLAPFKCQDVIRQSDKSTTEETWISSGDINRDGKVLIDVTGTTSFSVGSAKREGLRFTIISVLKTAVAINYVDYSGATKTVNLDKENKIELISIKLSDDNIRWVSFVDKFGITNEISSIRDLFPNEASAKNQLADKAFVNSSIGNNTGAFVGTYPEGSTPSSAGTPINEYYDWLETKTTTDTKNNSYSFWWHYSDDGTNVLFSRYKYTKDDTKTSISELWQWEYNLNNSSFTAKQLAAINSGATTDYINQITTNKDAIGTLTSLKTSAQNDLVNAINETHIGFEGKTYTTQSEADAFASITSIIRDYRIVMNITASANLEGVNTVATITLPSSSSVVKNVGTIITIIAKQACTVTYNSTEEKEMAAGTVAQFFWDGSTYQTNLYFAAWN